MSKLFSTAPVNACDNNPCNPDGSSKHGCINEGGGDYSCDCATGYEHTSSAKTACTGKDYVMQKCYKICTLQKHNAEIIDTEINLVRLFFFFCDYIDL